MCRAVLFSLGRLVSSHYRFCSTYLTNSYPLSLSLLPHPHPAAPIHITVMSCQQLLHPLVSPSCLYKPIPVVAVPVPVPVAVTVTAVLAIEASVVVVAVQSYSQSHHQNYRLKHINLSLLRGEERPNNNANYDTYVNRTCIKLCMCMCMPIQRMDSKFIFFKSGNLS